MVELLAVTLPESETKMAKGQDKKKETKKPKQPKKPKLPQLPEI